MNYHELTTGARDDRFEAQTFPFEEGMEPGAEAHGQTAVLGRGRRLANQAPAHEFEPVRGPVRQRMELFRSQRLARCTGVSHDRPQGGLIAQRER